MIETFSDRDDEDAHAEFHHWRARHWGAVLREREPA